jgi:hypothetical protein
LLIIAGNLLADEDLQSLGGLVSPNKIKMVSFWPKSKTLAFLNLKEFWAFDV